MFQQKAWADREFSNDWLDQIQPTFCECLRSIDCSFFSFATFDGGLERQVKFEVGYELEEWLEGDENLNLMEHGKLSASDKRVLITKFVGAAWEKNFSRTDFSPNIYFERTGCLLTLDGSEDHRVNIEGMPHFIREGER